MTSLQQTFAETFIISLGRVSLFYGCRHFLLRSLYYDLRDLSSPSVGASAPADPATEGLPRPSGIELDELPPPATTPRNSTEFSLRSQELGTQRTWHSTLARSTFSLCFSESCSLFLLVLMQAMDTFSSRARYTNWRISLGLLVFTLLLAAPLLQCVLLTYRAPIKGTTPTNRSFLSHFLMTGIPYCIYLLMLSYIPLPGALKSQDLTTATLSRLVVLGTLILGILTGFGAASAIFTHFQLSKAIKTSISAEEILAAEQALFRVRNDLLGRRQQLERNETAEPGGETSFLSRLKVFSANPEHSALRLEIQGLEALEYQMNRNLETLQRRSASARHSGTLKGKIWGWITRLFALYCAFRVISSLLSLISPFSSKADGPGLTPSSSDLIAYFLAQVVSLVVPISEAQIAAASKQLSLLLAGAIILSSVRRALSGVARVLKITSKNLAASLLMLLLAQLMGTYMLSTLIQMRTSFPNHSEAEDQLNLFATLPEYHVFGSLWDWAFLASFVASGVARWIDGWIDENFK